MAGVFAGSLVTALATGRFKLEGYSSPRHMLRSIAGAALMGAGGAMAYGCSIGQGLTGLSTLALASFIAVAGILARHCARACAACCGFSRWSRRRTPVQALWREVASRITSR